MQSRNCANYPLLQFVYKLKLLKGMAWHLLNPRVKGMYSGAAMNYRDKIQISNTDEFVVGW